MIVLCSEANTTELVTDAKFERSEMIDIIHIQLLLTPKSHVWKDSRECTGIPPFPGTKAKTAVLCTRATCNVRLSYCGHAAGHSTTCLHYRGDPVLEGVCFPDISSPVSASGSTQN